MDIITEMENAQIVVLKDLKILGVRKKKQNHNQYHAVDVGHGFYWILLEKILPIPLKYILLMT